MSSGTKRAILRWMHIVTGIPIVGYIYTPFEALYSFAHIVRFIFVPILVISGLWMWKGHVVRRLFTKQPA